MAAKRNGVAGRNGGQFFLAPWGHSGTAINPGTITSSTPGRVFLASSYYHFDVSMHTEAVATDSSWQRTVPLTLKANTLGDLTKREYRYAHPHWVDSGSIGLSSLPPIADFFPYDISKWFNIRLPTYRENAAAYFYPNINPTARTTYPLTNPVAAQAGSTPVYELLPRQNQTRQGIILWW